MAQESIQGFLDSEDPLSDEACVYLLKYNEEDSRVDYKEDFDHDIDKFWINLAVDIVSFANTHGGYIVFGIKDKSYEQIGISELVYKKLLDIKQVLEKINRGIQPKFTEIRSKGKIVDDRYFVFLHVPMTINRTHVFEQNIDFRLPGKEPITLVRQGTVYTRKSGSNQILTSDGFEEIIHRRIDLYKGKILEGIARVVESEIGQEVIIVSPDEAEDGTKSYTVTDAPDAINIKGVSLAIQPKTLEDKVAVWIAINKSDKKNLPTEHALMELYANRRNINLICEQKQEIARFSMLQGLPTFYWLRNIPKNTVKELIENTFIEAKNIEKMTIINISGFYGVSFYEKLRGKYSSTGGEQCIKKFNNLYSLFNTHTKAGEKAAEDEADIIANKLREQHSSLDIYSLMKLDCALYAPFNT
jgi:hypothetical protein